MIDLTHSLCLAEGSQRWIYRHPHDATRLLKVFKPRADTAGRAPLATWTERHFPTVRTRWARKESREYTRLMLAHPTPIHSPVSHMYGFAYTSLGLACVTDLVFDAGTLGHPLSKTVTDADLGLLNDTLSRLMRFDIRASDITPRNFVFGQRTIAGVTSARECVLVDGFGDIHAIPIRSWGRWFNQKALNESFAKLARRLDLHWNSSTHQLSRQET